MMLNRLPPPFLKKYVLEQDVNHCTTEETFFLAIQFSDDAEDLDMAAGKRKQICQILDVGCSLLGLNKVCSAFHIYQVTAGFAPLFKSEYSVQPSAPQQLKLLLALAETAVHAGTLAGLQCKAVLTQGTYSVGYVGMMSKCAHTDAFGPPVEEAYRLLKKLPFGVYVPAGCEGIKGPQRVVQNSPSAALLRQAIGDLFYFTQSQDGMQKVHPTETMDRALLDLFQTKLSGLQGPIHGVKTTFADPDIAYQQQKRLLKKAGGHAEITAPILEGLPDDETEEEIQGVRQLYKTFKQMFLVTDYIEAIKKSDLYHNYARTLQSRKGLAAMPILVFLFCLMNARDLKGIQGILPMGGQLLDTNSLLKTYEILILLFVLIIAVLQQLQFGYIQDGEKGTYAKVTQLGHKIVQVLLIGAASLQTLTVIMIHNYFEKVAPHQQNLISLGALRFKSLVRLETIGLTMLSVTNNYIYALSSACMLVQFSGFLLMLFAAQVKISYLPMFCVVFPDLFLKAALQFRAIFREIALKLEIEQLFDQSQAHFSVLFNEMTIAAIRMHERYLLEDRRYHLRARDTPPLWIEKQLKIVESKIKHRPLASHRQVLSEFPQPSISGSFISRTTEGPAQNALQLHRAMLQYCMSKDPQYADLRVLFGLGRCVLVCFEICEPGELYAKHGTEIVSVFNQCYNVVLKHCSPTTQLVRVFRNQFSLIWITEQRNIDIALILREAIIESLSLVQELKHLKHSLCAKAAAGISDVSFTQFGLQNYSVDFVAQHFHQTEYFAENAPPGQLRVPRAVFDKFRAVLVNNAHENIQSKPTNKGPTSLPCKRGALEIDAMNAEWVDFLEATT